MKVLSVLFIVSFWSAFGLSNDCNSLFLSRKPSDAEWLDKTIRQIAPNYNWYGEPKLFTFFATLANLNTEYKISFRYGHQGLEVHGRVLHGAQTEPTGLSQAILKPDGTEMRVHFNEVDIKTIRVSAAPLEYPPLSNEDRLPSRIAKLNQIPYLFHGGSFSKSLGVFSAGKLGTSGKVFLEAQNRRFKGNKIFSDSTVNGFEFFFVFDVEVLDRSDYHIERGWWHYGDASESAARPNDPLSIHSLFWELSHGIINGNEVVFARGHHVDFKYLRFVLVKPALRAQLVAHLKQISFVPPNSASIEDFVIAADSWP